MRENNQLLQYFMDHYHTRQEVLYRLPVSLPLSAFWPELLSYRRSQSTALPLHAPDGEAYWYVLTARLVEAGDRITGMARSRAASQLPQYQEVFENGLLDEAYFSSLIEGASTTRQEAHAFLKSGAEPTDQSQRMILNNYQALDFCLKHLDDPIGESTILAIARILTQDTEVPVSGFRQEGVKVVSGRQEIVYVAPPPQRVKAMMDELIAFVADPAVHPVIKACAFHVVFVTIHPFEDGNGRTARAVSYLILLQAGYDFFRQYPISGIVAQERPAYYKAIRDAQSPENGYDLTYFLAYYAGMLARSVDALQEQATRYQFVKNALDKLRAKGEVARRIQDGLEWLLTGESKTMTADIWRKKWKVSFETARKDLMLLEQEGILRLEIQGRRHVYRLME